MVSDMQGYNMNHDQRWTRELLESYSKVSILYYESHSAVEAGSLAIWNKLFVAVDV